MTLDEFILREEMFVKLYKDNEDQIKDLPGYETAKAEHKELLLLLRELRTLRKKCKQKCSTCKHDENEDYEYPCHLCKYSYPSQYSPKEDEEE